MSRAFDPDSNVSAKTRKKVLDITNEFNYKPNALARGLITNKSKLIGIAMKEKQNPFYYEVLSLFTQKLKDHGFSVLFVHTENEEIQQEEIAKFWEYNVEAIIVTDAFLSSDLVKKLKNANIPVILFNRENEDLQCNTVSSDNIYASQSIAKYFYNKKHKKFYMFRVTITLLLTEIDFMVLIAFLNKKMKKLKLLKEIILSKLLIN